MRDDRTIQDIQQCMGIRWERGIFLNREETKLIPLLAQLHRDFEAAILLFWSDSAASLRNLPQFREFCAMLWRKYGPQIWNRGNTSGCLVDARKETWDGLYPKNLTYEKDGKQLLDDWDALFHAKITTTNKKTLEKRRQPTQVLPDPFHFRQPTTQAQDGIELTRSSSSPAGKETPTMRRGVTVDNQYDLRRKRLHYSAGSDSYVDDSDNDSNDSAHNMHVQSSGPARKICKTQHAGARGRNPTDNHASMASAHDPASPSLFSHSMGPSPSQASAYNSLRKQHTRPFNTGNPAETQPTGGNDSRAPRQSAISPSPTYPKQSVWPRNGNTRNLAADCFPPQAMGNRPATCTNPAALGKAQVRVCWSEDMRHNIHDFTDIATHAEFFAYLRELNPNDGDRRMIKAVNACFKNAEAAGIPEEDAEFGIPAAKGEKTFECLVEVLNLYGDGIKPKLTCTVQF